jgi:DMSO reductase anchor subunit
MKKEIISSSLFGIFFGIFWLFLKNVDFREVIESINAGVIIRALILSILAGAFVFLITYFRKKKTNKRIN